MNKEVVSLLLVAAMTASMLVSCKGSSDEIVGADAEEDGNNVMVVDILLTAEDYGIGVDKDNPELLQQINTFIEKGLVDGTYDEIASHYFDRSKEPVPVYSVKLDNSKDQLVVATTGDFEPFDYDVGNAYYGIDKELIKAIADYLGKELVLVPVNFDTLFMTVSQKKCDACIAGITIKEEREKYVDFSVPYFHAGQSIAVRKDNKEFIYAKTKEDVEKIILGFDETKTVAVEDATSGEDYLLGKDPGGFAGVNCNIKRCANLKDALIALSNEEVDCVIGDSACIKYIIAHDFSDYYQN
ncbi:transporter substrate-binding domain-containing protein [Butyrivibrio sp. INlla16]|uniref:transporter substrate-binding domain-containing protein n=1 Tax=Butyrivibrio sp. INlla16 TaxID=1520807 RepID=UPI00087E302A|nr:transporter substrate-binding domain-containing protein [Butyrivibrio sp. INlla16]SDB58629.1 polar amino acid transport system substrate-binding protein [Butyrivibrio sp. INlla16]